LFFSDVLVKDVGYLAIVDTVDAEGNLLSQSPMGRISSRATSMCTTTPRTAAGGS